METIIHEPNILPTIFSIILIIGSLIFLFFGWRESIKTGDPTGAFATTICSVIVCGVFVEMLPTETYTEYQDISKYDVLVTDRFVKVFDHNQKEVFSTTDFWTISNIKKFNTVKHVRYKNIYGFNSVTPDEYFLVEKTSEMEKK